MQPIQDSKRNTINREQERYLETQMDRVSRSFAVVVKNIEQPLHAYLATAYLLCRIADNIEDCNHKREWKLDRFTEFMALLDNPSNSDEVLTHWSSLNWPNLNLYEVHLMGLTTGKLLWRIYSSFQYPVRAIIQRWVHIMADRMSHLGEAGHQPVFTEKNGIRVLLQKSDYDEYCYIVAGTVGLMATELAIHHYNIDDGISQQLMDTSEICGRALQKTNILKDYAKDLKRKFSYIPADWLAEAGDTPLTLEGAPKSWVQFVIEDVLSELEIATDYVLALPERVYGYRIASLLCLLPALQTNLLAAQICDKLFTPQHEYKISRLTLSKCVGDARRMVGDNQQVQNYSDRLQSEIKMTLMNNKNI